MKNDALNRLDLKTYPDTSTVDYVYDKGSRLVDIIDSNGTIHNSYDAANRVTQVTYPGTKSVAYEYDANSNRTKLTYPDNTYITYEYDQLNRLTYIKDQAAQSIANYQYDKLSRRTQVSLANNTQAVYEYDAINRLSKLINQQTGENPFSQYQYTFDKVGNRKSMTTLGGSHTYTYDKIYQLKTVDYPEGCAFLDTTFNYDGLGNRSSVVGDTTTNYTPNSLNQYAKIGTTDYTYDENGNLTSNGDFTYEYDYENRLISATKTGTDVSYSYDPLGRRIGKDVNGTATKFLYDGDQIIAEYDGSGTLQAKYIFGSGIDEPIKGLSPTGTVPEWYYHFDGLGSVTGLTDSSGSVAESYEYDVFGSPSTTSTLGNRFMFTGREYDEETGLYYYRARYYSPSIGRFLQRDPVGYTAGINLYSYCDNNPINFSDPRGLDKEKPWWLAIGIATIATPFPGDEGVFWGVVALASLTAYIMNRINVSELVTTLTNRFARSSRDTAELTGYHAGNLVGSFDLSRSSPANRYGPALYTNNTPSGAIAERPNQPHLYQYQFDVQSSKVLNVPALSKNKIVNWGVRTFATITGKQIICYPSKVAPGTTNYAVIDRVLATMSQREQIY